MSIPVRLKTLLTPAVIIGCSILSGCSQYMARTSASQPLNTLIAPASDSRQIATKSTLTFPAAVAVIVVPPTSNGFPKTALRATGDVLKEHLLANTKYVRSVAVVSMDDITGKVSLSQIRDMYDTDIALIVTYEQDQKSQQNGPGGLVDATIVGAFVVPTVETVTATHVEGKIVHIPSNALMFRQSGKDRRSDYSTSYGREGMVFKLSTDSLTAATNNLAAELTKTLHKFEQFDAARAVSMNVLVEAGSTQGSGTAADGNWNNVDSFKFSGGGSVDYFAWLLAIPLLLRNRARRTA